MLLLNSLLHTRPVPHLLCPEMCDFGIKLLILLLTLFPHITNRHIHGLSNRKDGSIWTDTAGVSLPPVFSHHTTSVDNFNRDNYGLKSQLKQLSKDSLWSSLTRKRGILPSNPLNREALDFFNSLYLTSVIVVTLLAYNRYKQNHWLFGTKTDIEFNFHTINETKLHRVNHYVSDIEISLYCLLPLRTMSRIWGQINSIPLPVSMRKVVINGYIKSFGCNLDEALDTDLTNYKNLSEFFRRSLRPGVRPIHPAPGVVSPADGTVLHFGQVWDGRIEQVKGITYSLRKFLGPQIWCPTQDSPIDYQRRLLLNNSPSNPTALYSCVVYLSPGDYHRFHSPADWSVDYRRHFAGHLLSVNPGVVRLFPQLFTLNERVVYSGRWPYGYFSMTAVGATAVGTVRVYFDEDLVTNERQWTTGDYQDRGFTDRVDMVKGGDFGEFNLGSTIVLIFEAPVGMEFHVSAGQRVKYGELLAKI